MTTVIFIILSYLLGSIPFGFIIGKISGKNVLDVGWKKTSGSNVYKNVGKLQGILTGILDVLKGYFAVYISQKFGLSQEAQILSGVAAVVGHNWSVFLKFSGGRGLGTFAGALFALASKTLLYSLIPFIIFALFWNAAIATIVVFISIVFISMHFGQFQTAGIFALITLIPMTLKRLSPISEIKKTKEGRWPLFRNRLIFDRDEFVGDLRINRIFREEKSSKLFLALKVASYPLVTPPKIGWKMAKYSAGLIKKPIDILLKNQERVVFKIDAEDLKKIMITSAKKIVTHQEDINKINVFPVADKDTGYNLAATLLGIEGLVSRKKYSTIRELTEDIKEAAMINARGNAGMIFTGYLIELLNRIKHLKTINAFHFAYAMKKGAGAARKSVAHPVEGTILDVISAAGDRAFESASAKSQDGKNPERNIIKILEQAYESAKKALDETPEKLAVLKQNNVVDAGGLGFLKILEAWIENFKGESPAPKIEVDSPIGQISVPEDSEYKYEVVLSFVNIANIPASKIEEELFVLGGSLEIIELEGKIKLHIHTNQPQAVKEKFEIFPDFEEQTEDLSGQEQITQRRPLGLVVDQVADLPAEFLKKYEIEEVPFTTRFPNGEIIVSKEEIYLKMAEALKKSSPLPTTSAPTFKSFLSAYQAAFKKFEKFLVITVSSKVSGTYSSARIARSIFKKPDKLNIYVFDSFTGEVGEGLVAFHAQDMILQGKTIDEIVEDLKKFCPKVIVLGCFDDFRYLSAGGRVKLPKIFLPVIYVIQKIGIRALIGIKAGSIKFFGINFGKNTAKILSDEIDRHRNQKEIIAAIAHANNEKAAEDLKFELEKKQGVRVLFISQISPVVATHTGPGALLVGFYPAGSVKKFDNQ
jgi:hypothetical protein